MEYKQYEVIKHNVGFLLLNFVLNLKDSYHYRTNHKSIELSEDQKLVADDLFKRIQECRHSFVEGCGIGDGRGYFSYDLSHDNPNLFNEYHVRCGGEIPRFEADDKLLELLVTILIREFPNLLVTSKYLTPDNVLNYGVSQLEKETFVRLVKEDQVDSLTNHEEGNLYSFYFQTDDGHSFGESVVFSLVGIIGRSFRNACFKNNLSYEGVIEEIKENLNILRNLALGNEVEYSSFVSVVGLSLNKVKKIDFISAKLINMLKIDDEGNVIRLPSVRHYSASGGLYTAETVFEIKHKTKFLPFGDEAELANNRFFVQERAIDNLKFSLAFELLGEIGISVSFSEFGFPLLSCGNSSLDTSMPNRHVSIQEDRIEGVVTWFNMLLNKDLRSIEVPLTRLKYAIYERKRPQDAFVDAVIAWEAIFSDKLETTFQVTSSIAVYIYNVKEREDRYGRLKKLYGWRSNLVHGTMPNELKKQNIEEISLEAIEVGIICLKKLLQDEILLPLKPAARVKRLLVMK
ncbi:HEPN domain-containing protein [Marinobacterium sedimentorum]|uniref:HEPN domain-containing protein n=1 Tax=Marinobacterium sedimentorum TaxID=2927804 RepID=UPI0020C6EABE|nr:HEPN domain-containing protein [Marinobacterium sedimentorum]MCP8686621.1 HEPN domain-containing protein [Marinobacterium sedimentorum]